MRALRRPRIAWRTLERTGRIGADGCKLTFSVCAIVSLTLRSCSTRDSAAVEL